MLGKLLCWLGLHDWLDGPSIIEELETRDCYRCRQLQARADGGKWKIVSRNELSRELRKSLIAWPEVRKLNKTLKSKVA